MTEESFDIAPFALPNTPSGEIRFEEPRDIVRVMAEFSGSVPENAGLFYLRRTWPETRAEEQATQSTPARLGWIGMDDWFNVEWHPAAVKISREGQRLWFEFEGLSSEFPDMADYDVAFRRTLGLRVDGADDAVVNRLAVFTASQSTETTLRVELDAGRATPGDSLRISGHNAVVDGDGEVNIAPLSPHEFTITLRHMVPAHPYCGDEGLLTFALDDETFTISLVSLEQEGPVWFEELGVFITRADDTTRFGDYRKAHAGAQTLNQRVLAHAEQSLAGAMNGQPRPHPVNFAIGCPHARQRFRIEPNGDVDLMSSSIKNVPGKDTDRVKYDGAARFFFGLEAWTPVARFADPEPMLAYNVHARRSELGVDQKSFAVPLLTGIASGSWAGDDPMVALVRFRFRNDGAAPVTARLPLRYSSNSRRTDNPYQNPGDKHGDLVPRSPLSALSVSGNRVVSEWEGDTVIRCAFETAMTAESNDGAVVFSQQLAPGQTCDLLLKIPYIALESQDELAALDALAFDACYEDVQVFWRKTLAQGARVSTPEPQLAALHEAHLAHVLISDFEMPDGSGLVNTSVGTSTYGNFTNESCMIVNELDQRGLHDQARRRLGIWLKYQGQVPQPGNFTDYDGMFYGAGGFECGSYNQHHGWALWCLCEHFFITRDAEWFASVSQEIIAAADWVFRQRRNTMGELPHSRGWEHGFLPAGSLEDVTDFHYWLSTNALTWRGVEWAARALEAVDHAEAQRVRREADDCRKDLIHGFETMRRHAPLVRLRDGRWVPQYPSRLYRRGRDLGWIREVLEGSVYLIISGLFAPDSKEAGWILDDYQDNQYPTPPYGYVIPHFEDTWFNRAGFSIQPNLLAGLLPHLDRDEPEIYIWMFYNAWAACYREEITGMAEHPLPWLGFSNAANFKTSDEANAVAWMRYMFVYTLGDTLHLGRAIPRAWFAQSDPFEGQGVATRFGTVGVRYEPVPGKNALKATASLDLAQRPERILVRFRLPEGRAIKAARVNGVPHSHVDNAKGDVDISGGEGTVVVEVDY
jgi:hypothetical protein